MRIEQLKEEFEIEVGAPVPRILSDEHRLYLIFYAWKVDPNREEASARSKTDERIVTVQFDRFAQFKFGNPNDEAIDGHPLYELGLEPYSIQKVNGSEWIKELISMNSVHPYHDDLQFENYEHFIFFFHDTCFEIVAEGYTIKESSQPDMKSEIERIAKLL